MKELPKSYDSKVFEGEIYKQWESAGLFRPETYSDRTERYVNILPPPNANGELHLGHASGYSVMDTLGRFQRMRGKKVLLLPGKDHAGIQTQVVYEKKLKAERGLTRYDVGREDFYKEVYDFCIDRAAYMRSQEKRVGLSADWSREKFTLDPGLLAVVRETFVQMYNEVDADGRRMIYRGERVINWCHRCATALSDVEVEYEEKQAMLYTFRYWSEFPIAISSSRPETKLGDTAVAVHPDDERYKQFVGQTFTGVFAGVPLTIQVIADEGVDPAFGTGALGVTPAHSAVDFAMAEKNSLPIISVIDQQGNILPGFGQWSGMSAKEARENIVAHLNAEGRIEKEETYTNNLSVCERCKTPIEPLISKQWFVDMDHKNFSFKKEARKAIESGEITLYPDRFKDVLLSWIDNVHDWCISRQIWWGPRFPVWYRNDEIFVGIETPEGEGWEQDPDTFDTWFSSGQWAYTPLLASEGQKDFQEFYPSDTMIMGRDILPFWAFRMIFLSLYKTGKAPFRHLYFTGLVRDEHGKKMSKSKGNGIDVLSMIDTYGADATRLSLLIGSAPGNDMNLWEAKIAGFRNFTTKLWNISRFMLLNIESPSTDVVRPQAATLSDKWILSRLDEIITQATDGLETYQLSSIGEILRDFTWNDLADWYLEIAKVEGNKSEILNYIFNTMLKLWHPYMPFVTEQIWGEVYGKESVLMVEKWPQSTTESIEGVVSFGVLQRVISAIRSIRAQQQIEPAKKVNVMMSAGEHTQVLQENAAIIIALARLENCQIEKTIAKPDGAVAVVESGVEIFVDVSGAIDVEKEKARIAKELAEVEPYIKQLEAKLGGDFAKNAPPAIVEKDRQKLADAKEKYEKLISQRSSLV